MFKRLGTPVRLLASAIGSVLIVAFIVSRSAFPAGGGIAELITGSTGTIAASHDRGPVEQPMPAPLGGSTGLESALALIAAQHYFDAYNVARSLPDDVERRTIQWAAIYYGNGDVPYDSVAKFSADAPDFVIPGVFKTRIEQALLKASASPAIIIDTLGGAMPNTLDAQIALAGAYLATRDTTRAATVARSIWMGETLDAAGEARVLAALGSVLTQKDHWARAQHLMMLDRSSAVDRLLKFLTPGERSLAVARNAVSQNGADAKKLLDAVAPAYRSNPIYLFSRAQRARQFQLWDAAIANLDRGKAGDPDAEQWWYERRALIRQLLSVGDADRAYRAAAGYTHGPEGRLVEARFHAGWIALSFLHDPKNAERQFEAMARLSTLPDSVSQAQYWLGRAKAAAGDQKGAKAAYAGAAGYGTIYYGLLARSELGMTPVELRQMPAWQDSEAAFEKHDMVRAIHLLAATGRNDMATVLLRSLAPTLKSAGELVLAARLAQTIEAHHVAIIIADIANRRGVPLDLFSFPKDGLPDAKLAQIDKAAIYAVARTESRFQVDAVSSSGARGLMQLMPGTAQETARKIGVAYSVGKLTSDPTYNAQLGSSYLATQLSAYNGSLLLAAAAYNAGAGNANKWIAAFGDPRAANVDPVVWVELIPFEETRKYVQRVLGNYLIYRARLGGPEISLTAALHSIAG